MTVMQKLLNPILFTSLTKLKKPNSNFCKLSSLSSNPSNNNNPLLQKLDKCNNLSQLTQIQSHLIVLGLFQHPLFAGRLIKKLSSFPHCINSAISLLEKLENPDAFMGNIIIRGLINEGNLRGGVLFYYGFVIGRCIGCNHYTYPLIIRVFGDLGLVCDGEKVHCRVLKCGFGLDLFVKNSLIRMYSVLERVWDARKVFDESSVWDLVSWNSLIDGCAKNGQVSFARKVFDEMSERDEFSWNSMLSGYIEVGDMEMALEFFGMMPNRDIVSWNCLLDGCARVGDVRAARGCFDRMPQRNVVSWNTLLALFVRCKDYNECLRLFDDMVQGETRPNKATLVSVLTACGYLGKLDLGKWIHNYIKSDNSIKPDVLLSTALLTMYTKCGDMDEATSVFESMPEKSVVSWNSMIMGYGAHGRGEKALETFLEMRKSGPKPNDATFVCLLAACAHSGMVLEGWWYFDMMRQVYKIEPKVEHYGCMVDLLSRAGLLKDTKELIEKMPIEGGSALWGAFLSACHIHSYSQLGEFIGKWLINREPNDIGAYLLLSNIYASEGRWQDVDEVRKLMKEKGLHKLAGSSLSYFGDGELGSEYCMRNGSVHKRSMIYSMLTHMGAEVKLIANNLACDNIQ